MRISSRISQQLSIDAIQDLQTRLSKTQLQIAEGKRLTKPSDDPSGSSELLRLRQTLASTEQYQANASLAEARLSLEESTLDGVTNLLQRVRDLAVRATTDTMSSDDRQAIAREVDLRIDELLGQANMKDANGDYLFAGNKTQTIPFGHDGAGTFNYDGDHGTRELQIGPTRYVKAGDSGADVFLNVKDTAGNNQSIFETLWEFRDDLVNDTVDNDIIGDIDNAMDNVVTKRSEIGTRLTVLEAQQDINEVGILQTKEVQSSIEDLDYAEAISRYNQELTGLDAARKSHAKLQGMSLFNYV